MRIRLDGKELALPEGIINGGKKGILEFVQKKALTYHSVIVEIIVDNENLHDEDAFLALSGGLDVQFVSQPVRDLVGESLDEADRYFQLLPNGVESIATLFERKNDPEAENKFAQLIEGIEWLLQVFSKSCTLLGVNPYEMKIGNFANDIDALNKALGKLADVKTEGRTTEVAWILREELLPVVKTLPVYWSELRSSLTEPMQ